MVGRRFVCGTASRAVSATSYLVLSGAAFCAAREVRPAPGEPLIRETCDELKAMCREVSVRTLKTHQREGYRDSVRELAAKIRSLPDGLGVRAALFALVDRRPWSSTGRCVMVDALAEAGELNADVANRVIRFVRDRKISHSARGSALVMLLTSSKMRAVAPRDDLERLVLECMEKDHYHVRRRAMLQGQFLESPRVIRKLVEVARTEDDERLTFWMYKGLGLAWSQGIVPADLEEEVERLSAELHRKLFAKPSPRKEKAASLNAAVPGPDTRTPAKTTTKPPDPQPQPGTSGMRLPLALCLGLAGAAALGAAGFRLVRRRRRPAGEKAPGSSDPADA